MVIDVLGLRCSGRSTPFTVLMKTFVPLAHTYVNASFNNIRLAIRNFQNFNAP